MPIDKFKMNILPNWKQMVQLSQTLAPLISGNILIMCNPTLKSTKQIVENAQRASHIRIRSDDYHSY